MELGLRKSEIKTLREDKDGWSYEINTKWGKLSGSKIKSEEDAIIHCQEHIKTIIKEMLKK